MLKLKIIFICAVLFISSYQQTFAQYEPNEEIIEPDMMEQTYLPSDRDGFCIPSITDVSNGEYFRVMVIFAEFPDDNLTASAWPKGSAPTNLMNLNLIDQTVSQNSTNQNLTHFFDVMSLGKYKLIGDCYHVIIPHNRNYYATNNLKRSDINKEIIEAADNLYNIDWNDYDKWKKSDQGNGDYHYSWNADNKIDMIWIVYRNVAKDLSENSTISSDLEFVGSDNKTFSGEASLGYGDSFTVGNNLTIDMGKTGGYEEGSGLNIIEGYKGLQRIKNIIVHEHSHHLLGRSHVQTGLWGLLAVHSSRSYMVNSFERQRLGWINFIEYANNKSNIELGDYLTTGDVLRVRFYNSDKYLLLENHQRISVFDNIDKTNYGRGVYIIQERFQSNLQLKLLSADGRYDWDFLEMVENPYTGEGMIPKFKKGEANPAKAGYLDTEQIKYIDPITQTERESEIDIYNDINNNEVLYPLYKGDGKDAFKPGYNSVLSKWSNPRPYFLSNDAAWSIAVEIKESNGKMYIDQYVELDTWHSGSPSKPQILQIEEYNGHPKIKWLSNTEPDKSHYIVERSEAPEVSWEVIDNNCQTNSFIDNDVFINAMFLDEVFYRIKAVDTDGNNSEYSELASIDSCVLKKDQNKETLLQKDSPSAFKLFNCYPNPFNPTSIIKYNLVEAAFVKVIVYNSMGEEVEVLVSKPQPSGEYKVEFHSNNLPSGIYYYHISAGNYNNTKKMILLK